MKYKPVELVKALQIIQNECNEYLNGCSNCPFFINNKCQVIEIEPCDWNINSIEWKAFELERL